MGESTRLGGDLARLGFEGLGVGGVAGVDGVEEVLEADDALEKRDGRGAAVFAGDEILGDDGTLGDAGALLDDVDLVDPSLGVAGFEDGSFVDFGEGSLVSFDFEDFLGVDASGGGAILGDVGSGNAPIGVAFEGVAFGGAAGVGAGAGFGTSLEGAVLESLVFEGDAVAFTVSFAPDFFDVATVAGLGSGARSIKVAAGMLVFGAVNCPLAIWRARSFTLTNILTERRVHVQQNDPGDAHAFYEEHESFNELWPQCAQACAPQGC